MDYNMVILVRLLGAAIAACSIIYLINPEAMKKYMLFWITGRMIFAGAILAISIGIILLIAAPRCRLAWFVNLMGFLSIIKGLYIFTFGQKSLTSMLNWWISKPPAALRIVAILELALGILFIYSA